jgi:lysophospholipase L1-like esterase
MVRLHALKTRHKDKIKLLLFSILPALLLLLTAEVVLRATRLVKPSLFTLTFILEDEGVLVPDQELFWSLRPNLDQYSDDVKARVRTNSLGLRTSEVGLKLQQEFRILSLGESTTFGGRVSNEGTYSALLETLLNEYGNTHFYRVINAGVSAYSSFQSLQYLELRGLKLKPDLVLFYHELNDYLPSTLRGSNNTEIGILKTDRQLYESRMSGTSRLLMEHSALYAFFSLRYTRLKVNAFNRRDFNNPLLEIGLPDIAIPPRLILVKDGKVGSTPLNEQSLGRRVSEKERLENLENLLAICQAERIQLVIIHPAYADSSKHECTLTNFCRQNQVPMFEAYDVLHPKSAPDSHLFYDRFHPTAEGHYLLAKGLAQFLTKKMNFRRHPRSSK